VLESLELPPTVQQVRVTPTFDAESVPAGLLSAHRIASGVWGRLVVHTGSVVFALEPDGERRAVNAGEHQVIEPNTPHHVEPTADASFAVEFYR